MKILFTFLISLLSISVNAAGVTVKHQTCQAVLSVGAYGRYVMYSTYNLDMDGYTNVVTRALNSKGYRVVETLNYGEVSAFGNEGIKRSKDNKALALEFRIAAPSYDYEGTEKHRCAGGLKLMDPKSEVTHSVSDSDGRLIGEFTTYPSLYEKELETEISRWLPLRFQCQSVFNALLSAMPSCSIEK